MDINSDIYVASIDEIDDSKSAVQSSYESEWNDDVHESFQNYIDEINVILGEMEEMSHTLADIANGLADVDIDALSEECDGIIGEIEAA